MKQLHTIQLSLLKKLVYSPGLSFSDLRIDKEMENNALHFHLKKLVEIGYVRKDEESGLYILTPSGKEYANTMDTGELFVKKQAKLGTLICCTRDNDLGGWDVLLYTRHKQPFYGKQGILTGKIHRGEQVHETAERELLEEANLVGAAKVIKLVHILELNTADEVIEDKFLHLCHVHNPSGQLQGSIEGDYARVPERDITTYVTNPFHSLQELLDFIQDCKKFDGKSGLDEVSYVNSEF